VASGTFKGPEQKAFASAITFTCLNTGKLERDVSVPVRRTKLFPANVSSMRGTYESVAFCSSSSHLRKLPVNGSDRAPIEFKSAVGLSITGSPDYARLPDHPIL